MDNHSNIRFLLNKHPYLQVIKTVNAVVEGDHISVLYEGEIVQELIKYLAVRIENKLKEYSMTDRVRKVLFHVSIEMLQNICKYSDDKIKNRGIFIFGKTDSLYFISSGNIIMTKKYDIIENKINYLNMLNSEELTKIYESYISQQSYNNLGGAGLGFVDIIRRTGQKLQCNFEKISDDTSFLLLTATILK